MKGWKTALFALVAAVIVEAMVTALAMALGGLGANALFIISHLPGITIADTLHLNGALGVHFYVFFLIFTGFVQFFLVFWLVTYNVVSFIANVRERWE